MATLTISLKEPDERNVRKLAREMYGQRKGAISKAIAEAVQHNLKELEQEKLRKRALEILKNGRSLGKRLWKKRDDLYD